MTNSHNQQRGNQPEFDNTPIHTGFEHTPHFRTGPSVFTPPSIELPPYNPVFEVIQIPPTEPIQTVIQVPDTCATYALLGLALLAIATFRSVFK